MDYKGIKIPEEIIIVENAIGQGYVVIPGSSIDGALNWAKGNHGKWVDGKWIEIKREPIVNNYKNGEFTISLYDSANRSSQGGKLSFWNCTIHAPDGKDYVIGINSDILFELLINSTIVNGDIQGKVWLGKEKTNTGVYTENMEMFKQAREEDRVRSKIKSAKYEPLDIVSDLNGRYVYLGKYPNLIEEKINMDGWYERSVDVILTDKPEYVHVYVSLYEDNSFSYLQMNKTKTAKIIENEKFLGNGTPNELFLSKIKDYDLENCSEYNVDYYKKHNYINVIDRMRYGLIPIDEDVLLDAFVESSYYRSAKLVDKRAKK